MASSRTVIIAGAGIGGLTSALAVARHGFDVLVLDQAVRLEEIGAGIQLSPNASRALVALGLRDRLVPHVVAPQELDIGSARTGRVLTRAALGADIERRYGAPYWVIHRGDLQAALLDAVRAQPGIAIRLGTRVDDFALHRNGITVAALGQDGTIEERGLALIGADGLWSRLRNRLGHGGPLRFAGASAWRALLPAEALACELSVPTVNLWLGRGGHVVHYPVKAGRMINVVAIVPDDWQETGWSAAGLRAEILSRLDPRAWRGPARELVAAVERWSKWALYDAAPLPRWGEGPATLVGDAAHPMLPYLAQGAAMAIEDAATLGRCIGERPDELAPAMRRYEALRRARTARVQRAAEHNGAVYHTRGLASLARSLALTVLGGDRLVSRYDWLYGYAAG